MYPESSIRRRRQLPPWVVPFNPDDEEIEPQRLRLVPPIAEKGFTPPYFPMAEDGSSPTPITFLDPQRPDFNSGAISDTINLPPISPMRRDGRPSPNTMLLDPEMRAENYRTDVEGYEPKRGISKKRALLEAAIGFLGGGIPGAIGRSGGYMLDPNRSERGWRENELGRLDERQNTIQTRRRQGLQDRLLQARVNTAENPIEPEPESWDVELDTDNDGIPDIVERQKRTIGSRRPIYQKPERPTRPTVKVSVAGQELDVTPEAALSYLGREPKAVASDNNEQLNQSITEAQTERDRIGASLKDVPPTIPGAVYTQDGKTFNDPAQPNPAYTDLMKRYRELDDQIRGWRTKLKRAPVAAGGKKWSASKWARANPTLDLSAAKAEAKRRGLTVVE